MKKKFDIQKSIIYIAFIALFVIFSITLRNVGAGFASISNIMNILRQTCLVAIMAVGMTFVLGAALIDLSTGPLVACTSLVCGLFLQQYGLIAGVIAGLLFGVLAGVLNGFLIAYLKMPPFIATLGTQTVFTGMARTITNLQSVPITNKTFINIFGGGNIGVVPSVLIWMLGVFIIGVLLMYKMPFGRKVLAVGGNTTSAKYSGINIAKVQMNVMILMSVLCALAGILWAGRFGGGRYTLGEDSGTSVIAASVLGGTSMMGGKVSVYGAIVGALMMGMLDNALVMYGLSVYQQTIVRGIVIIIAVAVSTVREDD
ncbi:ABC transporter permease [Blautia ammoniilytica]|uniref:ABC transporter permease n=1 Tax=Blautia ammoniilytica TaxID=2981782 RepID=A0ABT2TQX0_9FIRM|nr:ABC transporter permease [Blautia ammoniilytica]MCU6764617.1 ABC transporter permease [Blautia ammoniilytica]SCH51186.1 Ribose transport system permease protein rbsC [uncultured Blautia sp.]